VGAVGEPGFRRRLRVRHRRGSCPRISSTPRCSSRP
jgi:hypothetical protein